MLIQFNLKQTKPIDLCKALEAYIMQHYQESSLYERVKPSIEATQKIRNSMDFDKINISIANDSKTQEDLEQNLLTYLKYLAVYKKRIRLEHNDASSVKVTFMWGCSYNHTSMAQSSSINYEMASIYYNLAITEYYLGSAKLLRETDLDRKQAISRLRNGAWAVQQCKQLVPLLPSELTSQNVDFSLANLDALENSLIALSYKALYENIARNEKEFGIQNVACVLYESSKYFMISLQNVQALKQQYGKKIKEQTMNSFLSTINYFYVWTVTLACIKLAQCHYQKIQDESRGQHMGKALGFLAKADSTISPIVNDKNSSKTYTPFQLDALKGLAQQLQALRDNYVGRNTQIYKEQVVVDALLPFPPIPENLKIKPLLPASLNEPLPDEKNFEGFISEEAIMLTRDIKGFVEQRKYELDEAFKTLNDQKSKAYAENFVNVFLDMSNGQNVFQSQTLPASLKQKIENIRARGGMTLATRQVENAKQVSIQCDQFLAQVRQKLAAEKAEDDNLRKQNGQKWNRQPSDSLTMEFNKVLNELGVKLRQAQSVDMEVQGQLQQCAQFIHLTELPDPDIAAQMPRQNDNIEFLNANGPLINQLVQQDNAATQTQEEMKQIIFRFYEVINQTNYTQQAIQAISKGIPKSQVQQEALVPVSQLIEQFNLKVYICKYCKMGQVSSQVSGICVLASQLQQIKRQSRLPEQVSTNFSNGFNQAQEVFDSLDFGLAFYTQLRGHLEDLDRRVLDYIMARAVERDELLKSLNKQAPAPGPGNQPHPIPPPNQQPYNYPSQQYQYPQGQSQQFQNYSQNVQGYQQPQYQNSQPIPGYGQSQYQYQPPPGQSQYQYQGSQQGYGWQQPPK